MKFLSISLLTVTMISAFVGAHFREGLVTGGIDRANVENAANNRPGANGSGIYKPQQNLGENGAGTQHHRFGEDKSTWSPYPFEAEDGEMGIPTGEMDRSNEEMSIPTGEMDGSNEEMSIPTGEMDGSNEEMSIPTGEMDGSNEEMSIPTGEMDGSNNANEERSYSNLLLGQHRYNHAREGLLGKSGGGNLNADMAGTHSNIEDMG